MKKKPEAGATARRFDAAFKAEAVRLWQSSGQAAAQSAAALGIRAYSDRL